MSNPRRANGSRRTALLRRMRAEGRPCWICGMAIDYGLPPGDPLAFECAEIVHVSRGGSPIDGANTAPAHRCCNNWRGNRDAGTTRMLADAALAQAPAVSPLEFVRAARLVEKGKAITPSLLPVKTTTDW